MPKNFREKHLKEYKCKQCGKLFFDFPCFQRVFCSKSCNGKSTKNLQVHSYKHTPEIRLKMSLSHKGKPSLNKGIRSSLETRIKQSIAKQKISPKEWTGFVKDKDTLERARFRRELQKAVFKRDDYTCKVCGNRGGQLQADHIKSWSNYPNLRFNLDNCRTLCMDCHYLTTYKRKNLKTLFGVITSNIKY